MIANFVSSPAAVLLLGPVLMLLLGSVPAAVASRHPLTLGLLIQAVGLAALLSTIAAALLAALGEATAPVTSPLSLANLLSACIRHSDTVTDPGPRQTGIRASDQMRRCGSQIHE